jgi:hypothetical protein
MLRLLEVLTCYHLGRDRHRQPAAARQNPISEDSQCAARPAQFRRVAPMNVDLRRVRTHVPVITSIQIRRLSLKSVSLSIQFVIRLRRASSEMKTRAFRAARNVTLLALNGHSLNVELSLPDPDDECPLTLGPIYDDNLEFLDGVTFIPELPTFKRMTLPCGHSFGAMSLVYNFARKNMLCPCCRAGVGDSIHIDSIPTHFRDEIVRKVSASNSSASAEDSQGNSCELSTNETVETEFVRYFLDFEFFSTILLRPSSFAKTAIRICTRPKQFTTLV